MNKFIIKLFVFFILLMGIILPSSVFANDVWVPVGTEGFSIDSANNISLAFDLNIPYVAYVDSANGSKATVKKFDGTNWVTVGVEGFSDGPTVSTFLAFNSNIPYVAYVDFANGAKATVKNSMEQIG